MTKPGPRRTPTATLKARGSRHAKGRVGADVPCRKPTRPSWLKGDARREWDRAVSELMKIGTLAEIDRTMLLLYCEAYALFRQASREMAKLKSLTVKSKRGCIVQHPIVRIQGDAWTKLQKAAAEFGMSPASRTGQMQMPTTKPSDDKSKFFEKG